MNDTIFNIDSNFGLDTFCTYFSNSLTMPTYHFVHDGSVALFMVPVLAA